MIDTGDVILHKPSGETWTVAYVQSGHVVVCGWPLTSSRVDACAVLRYATPEDRLVLLKQMAELDDSRGSYARQRLEEAEKILPKEY